MKMPHTSMPLPDGDLSRTRDILLRGTSFLLTSHARPDGDSLGSQLALGNALRQLGKEVRIVNKDPAPTLYDFLPDLSTIEVAPSADALVDAVVVLECGSLSRTEVTGLETQIILNIDHHLGNTMYGTVNWQDQSACACAELVFDLVEALGARLTPSIATMSPAILYCGAAFLSALRSPNWLRIGNRTCLSETISLPAAPRTTSSWVTSPLTPYRWSMPALCNGC